MSYDNTAETLDTVEEAAEAPTKRVRKPKLDAEGNPVVKAVRTPKEPKPAKLYPQWNEDGTPLLDDAGEQVMLETKMKKPKAAKASAPRKTAVVYTINGVATSLKDLVDAAIAIVGDIGSRDGSKRAERVKAFEGANTVAEVFAAGGVAKDINRLAMLGRIELSLDGVKVEVAKAE